MYRRGRTVGRTTGYRPASEGRIPRCKSAAAARAASPRGAGLRAAVRGDCVGGRADRGRDDQHEFIGTRIGSRCHTIAGINSGLATGSRFIEWRGWRPNTKSAE